MLRSNGETLAVIADPYLAREKALAGGAGLHLLNLSPVSLPAPEAKAVYHGTGELSADKVIPPGGRAEY